MVVVDVALVPAVAGVCVLSGLPAVLVAEAVLPLRLIVLSPSCEVESADWVDSPEALVEPRLSSVWEEDGATTALSLGVSATTRPMHSPTSRTPSADRTTIKMVF